MKEYELKVIRTPANTTAAGVTGSYVDTQGLVGHGHKNVMFVLSCSKGTTGGTAGGSVQTASDTAGTGVATLVTFSTMTSAGGFEAKYGVIPASHRYVRFIGTVQTTKDMDLGCVLVAMNRYSP